MKLNFLLLLQLPAFAALLLSSHPKDHFLNCSHPPVSYSTPADSVSKIWVEDFKIFRDAVYKNDTVALKRFFKFPLLNPANEIWYLVLTEKELEQKKIPAGKIIPFTENDLNRYHTKLFPRPFIKALLKIKSEVLYRTGAAATPVIKDESATSVKIYASLDKKASTLTINTAYNTVMKDEDGTILDGGESNVIYTFRLLKNGHLQLLYVRLAG